MTKKIIVGLLALMFVFAVVGCDPKAATETAAEVVVVVDDDADAASDEAVDAVKEEAPEDGAPDVVVDPNAPAPDPEPAPTQQ